MEQDPNQINTTPAVAPQVINTPTVVAPPTYQQEATAPVVTNMGTSPVSRTNSKKLLLVFVGVVAVGLIGFGSFSYLRNKRQTSTKTAETIVRGTINSQQGSTSTTPDSNTGNSGQDNNTQTAPSTQQTTPSTSTTNNGTGSGSTTAKVYCEESGMPEGVCTVTRSIEKDGLKNNPYVAADTSQVPEGSIVQIDESSWKAGSSAAGSVDFTAVFGGKSYKGVGNLQVVDGVWKVVSYTLG